MYRWMARRPRITQQHGFTIVEVMVAMVILLIGLAGTITLLDQANASTTTDKAREGAVALSRELVEAARSQSYDQLTQGNVVSATRSRNGFTASAVNGAGWQIQRRGITYTMAVGVCSVDDPNDNTGARDPGFCAGNGTTTATQCAGALGRTGDIGGAGTAVGVTVGDCGIDLSRDGQVDNLTLGEIGSCTGSVCSGGGTTDKNPDDYKRVVTLVRWTIGAGSRFVLQSTSLPYPGLSGAPRVNSLTAAGNNYVISDRNATSFTATAVTNRRAASVAWSLDGTPTGTAAAVGTAGTQWTVTWPLTTAACAAGGTTPANGEVLDGAYVLGAKAFDSYAQAGPTKAQTVTLDRCAPYKPADPTVARIGGSGVEAVWNPNRERDIEGYQLFRVQGAGSASAVCSMSRALACTDSSFPSSGSWDYYVVAYDRDSVTNGFRAGAISAKITINLSNNPPIAPAGALAGSRLTASSTSISWAASPGDADGTIKGYRVYRDGTSLNNRYGPLLAASATSFTDTAATEGHTYYVAAVDNDDAESAKTAGVDIP